MVYPLGFSSRRALMALAILSTERVAIDPLVPATPERTIFFLDGTPDVFYGALAVMMGAARGQGLTPSALAITSQRMIRGVL